MVAEKEQNFTFWKREERKNSKIKSTSKQVEAEWFRYLYWFTFYILLVKETGKQMASVIARKKVTSANKYPYGNKPSRWRLVQAYYLTRCKALHKALNFRWLYAITITMTTWFINFLRSFQFFFVLLSRFYDKWTKIPILQSQLHVFNLGFCSCREETHPFKANRKKIGQYSYKV